jgi:hypothetical protein
MKTKSLVFLTILFMATGAMAGVWHGNGEFHGYPHRGGVYFGGHRYSAEFYRWNGGLRWYDGYSYPWWLMPLPYPVPVPYYGPGYGYGY